MNVTLLKTRWSAIGAAIAVTLGGGGLMAVQAASSPPSAVIAIDPVRVLDTRIDVGLSGPLVNGTARKLDVTGTIAVVLPGNQPGTDNVVPDGATSILANVTAVGPSTAGFVSVRPGTASGTPTTSNINVTQPGGIFPNSVTVALPTSGATTGTIDLYFFSSVPGATTHLLVDIVGYTVEGQIGAPGPQGATGSQGATGQTGARGVSSWDTIPSGQTVVGEFIYDSHSSGGFAIDSIYVPLGAVAPVDLTGSGVSFSALTFEDGNTACTGTPAAPTAPPGNVCIYAWDAFGIDTTATSAGPAFLQNRGFRVSIRLSATENTKTQLLATWAYTAP